MADLQKYSDYGKPTLSQGGWERTGTGNNYIRYIESNKRICTLDFIPSNHPTKIKPTGIASKTLEVSVLALRNDNYIIEALGWQANGAEFNVGNSYDKLGIMFRFQDNSNITPSNVVVQELEEWKHSLRKQCSATETIQSGDTIYANGQPITTYTLKGNEEHTGTPSPQNPVMPQGTGDRTNNLCEVSSNNVINYSTSSLYQYTINADMTISIPEGKRMFSGFPIKVTPSTTYTIHSRASKNGQMRLREYTAKPVDWPTNYIQQPINVALKNLNTESFTSTAETEWVLLCWYIDDAFSPCTLSEIMMIQGAYTTETLPNYEPYGFKIPILTAQTTPIYLSQPLYKIDNNTDNVDSSGTATYKITMQRITQISQANNFTRGFTVDVPVPAAIQTIYSNIAVGTSSLPDSADRDGKVFINSSKTYIGFGASEDFPIAGTGNPTQAERDVFQAYLQNNEVYIWYVLATPTTETVTTPSIPTVDGANSISIGTTVQPSEVSMTWTGWHNVEVKEKSDNLFDISTVNEGMYIRAGNVTESNPLGEESENSNYSCSAYTEVEPNTKYTVHYPDYQTATAAGLVYFSDKTVASAIEGISLNRQGSDTYTFTTPNNCNYIRFSWRNRNGNETMLNTGETALPYEPCWK